MKYIQGHPREQIHLFPISLDSSIGEDHEIRLIDLFVEHLPLGDYGFKDDYIENGRPAYHPKDLLKLYIYGYLNKIRSSRDLEKECKRNIELMWLMKMLKPDHNTISNFRRDNAKGIKKVFRETVKIASSFNLIGGVLIAGDSTKLRAQNSKKNNFNKKKIARHLNYIEEKLETYNQLLSSNDGDKEEKDIIKKEIKKHKNRKQSYKKIEDQLKESGDTQVSTSDPESRQMITRNNITEVAYNIQTTVDSENNIPIDYQVTNTNDSKAMGNMLRRAKTILRTSDFTALYDKGYHTGSEFKIADDLDVDVMVSIPRVSANAPNPVYNVEHFTYLKEQDYYICPEGHRLETTGKLHNAKTYQFKRYTTRACITCKVKDECSKAKYGKGIQRSEYQEYISQNKERIENNKDYYRKRQAIVEHPYGTIKRQWGFDHIMTKKTKERASADVGLIMIAYNLRRLLNILNQKQLKTYLTRLCSYFLLKKAFFKLKISKIQVFVFSSKNTLYIFKNALNRIYLRQISKGLFAY